MQAFIAGPVLCFFVCGLFRWPGIDQEYSGGYANIAHAHCRRGGAVQAGCLVGAICVFHGEKSQQ